MGCGGQFLIDTMQVAHSVRDLSSTNSTMNRKYMPDTSIRSLEERGAEFSQRRFLAMPLAGTSALSLVMKAFLCHVFRGGREQAPVISSD